jgi:hypothetical protein
MSFLIRKKREWKIQLLLEFLVLLNRVLADPDYFNGRFERLEQFILFLETQTTPLACRGTALCKEEDHLPLAFEIGQSEHIALTCL